MRLPSLALGSSAALAALALSCADPPPAALGEASQAATVCSSGPTLKGIDVSYYQGTIDWAQAKADGVEYAFVRVSDGLNTPDTKFAANWAGTKAAGVLRGVYQFFRPGQDPIAQADLLLSRMGTLEDTDLSPVIDVEATDGLAPAQVAAKVQAWVTYVASKTGRTPIIYTGYYFWRDMVGAPTIGTSPLWVAAYGVMCPMVPAPWSRWSFWQYSSSGTVAGISGGVDMDTFWGTRAELLATMGGASTCGDAVCSGTEDLASCPMDCPPCGVVPAGGGQIDDGDACFTGGGPEAYLRKVTGSGADGDLVWTHATDSTADANFGRWSLVLAEAGRYRVEVYTDHGYAQSRQARYAIRASGAEVEVTLDQSAADGWQVLGDYAFAAGDDQWVYLGDATGEAPASNVQLVFDAVRLTRLDAPSGDAGVGGDAGGGGGDDGGCAAGGGRGGGALAALLGLAAGRRRRRRGAPVAS